MPSSNQIQTPQDNDKPGEDLEIRLGPFLIKIGRITKMALVFLFLVLAFLLILFKF